MAFVYLITEDPFEDEHPNQYVKIGYSKSPPEWRMNANLKRGNPRKIRVYSQFKFEKMKDARQAEKAGHIQFKSSVLGKEWFKVNPEIVREWYINQGCIEDK